MTLHDRFEDRASLLEALITSSEDAIITKTLDGTITSWNPSAERVFGYAADEIVGRSILQLIPPALRYEEASILRRLRAGERVEHFETVRLKKDGTQFEVSLTISPLKDREGRVLGATKILRDISDRKKVEASLLQAEKIATTGRMAATIAHEINNPLEGLMNLIYLAKTSVSAPEEVISYLTAAEGELGRISHIAKQTLGFYREQASPTRTSLSNLVRDALSVYEPRLKHYNIRLEADLPSMPALVLRRGELMQVVSNMIVNAIHAMPEGGTLRVAVRPSRDGEWESGSTGLVLEIADTGTGISPEHLQRIFEPFFTTRGEIGTGIGLWIARQFVEGHDGLIAVTSSVKPEDHGTKMSIFLPWENSYAAETNVPSGQSTPALT